MSRRFRLLLLVVALTSALLAPQLSAKADAAQLRAGVAEAKELALVSRGDGRWVLLRALRPSESATVMAGDVRDAYGNVNGEPSATVSR